MDNDVNHSLIAAILCDRFDDDLDEDENFCHHLANSDSFEKCFCSGCIKLIVAFRKEGNPFKEQPESCCENSCSFRFRGVYLHC